MAVIGDETGKVLGAGVGGPTNYQLNGLEEAMRHLNGAVSMALGTAGLEPDRIDNAVFGMAGADYPVDFASFKDGISGLYPGLKFTVTNDTWVGFRAGTEKDFGGVVISGTGANFAAAGTDGRKVTGRGMGYEWGSEGGAGSLIRQVVHYAFRSHDGTGPKTGLEDAVLKLLEFPSYDELSLYMYRVHGEFGHIYMRVAQLVPALFELAFKGDQVAQDILVRTGTAMGEIVGGLMARVGMQGIPADVVLGGTSLTKGVCPLMVSALRMACQRLIPLASFRPVEMEPAAGGLLMALERFGLDVKGSVRQTVIGTFPELPDMPVI
jgi:N-acetylglucosamine kinase-like BadF-type ATPase